MFKISKSLSGEATKMDLGMKRYTYASTGFTGIKNL